MKTKDIAALGFLAVILIVVGVLVAGHMGKGSKAHHAEVEVVTPIDPSFSSQAVQTLQNANPDQPVQNFALPVNLQQGMGNANPFNVQQ